MMRVSDRITVAPGLIVDGTPTHDLFLSIEAIAAPSTFPRWRVWAEQAARDYSEPELRRLRHWFGARLWLGRSYHVLVPLLPDPRDPGQLLRVLGELPLGDFVRIAVTSGIVDPNAPLDAADLLALGRSPQRARDYVERYLRVSGQLRSQIIRTLSDPEGARSELIAVLRRQSDLPAFQRLIEESRDEREQATEALRQRGALGIEAVQQRFARNFQISEFAPLVLAPSIFLEAHISTYYQEIARSLLDGVTYEPLVLLIGTQRALGEAPGGKREAAPAAVGGEAVERAASTFSLLADPSRLRLIRLLAQRPYYGQELASALDMSGATISHHTGLLLKAGLLTIERRAHRTYFLLRAEPLAGLVRGATAAFLDSLSRHDAGGSDAFERTTRA